jgi:hypothetical protein
MTHQSRLLRGVSGDLQYMYFLGGRRHCKHFICGHSCVNPLRFKTEEVSPDPSSDPDVKAAFIQNSARPVSLSPNEESALSAIPSADLQDNGALSDYPRNFGPLPASLISSIRLDSTQSCKHRAGHQ